MVSLPVRVVREPGRCCGIRFWFCEGLKLEVAGDRCADELEVDSECRRGGALVSSIIICARVG